MYNDFYGLREAPFSITPDPGFLRHGAKENLVARPSEWPAPHCAEALSTGEPVRGVWISRTAQWVARNRGQQLSDEQASIAYKLRLDPLPCWEHWSAERYQRQIADLLQQIEQEAVERLKAGIHDPMFPDGAFPPSMCGTHSGSTRRPISR